VDLNSKKDQPQESELPKEHKKAIEDDYFLFGDYDYQNDWKETHNNDVM
jgi:hypothetical protein